MEIIYQFHPKEVQALFSSLESYFQMYPHPHIRLETVNEKVHRVCISSCTVSNLTISINYFRPIPIPPQIFITNEGEIKLRIDYSKIQNFVSPTPVDQEDSWTIGYLDPSVNSYADHIKRIRMMMSKSPWSFPLVLFAESLRVRTSGGSGTQYHLVPRSLDEVIPTLAESVTEVFEPREPNVINFTEPSTTTTTAPASATISVNVQSLNEAVSNFNRCMTNITRSLEERPRRNRRPAADRPAGPGSDTDFDDLLEQVDRQSAADDRER